MTYFKSGQVVKPKQDHKYLGVTKNHLAIVIRDDHFGCEVVFINKRLRSRKLIFCNDELRIAK